MDRRFFLKSSLTAAAMARFGFSKEPPMQPVDVISGNNQFALELFAKIRQEEGNLICSPFSVSTALAMTAAGARGKTAEQMQNVLHLPENRDAAHAAFARLIQQLNGPNKKDRGYALAVANALWGQKDYGFKKAFLEFLQQNYQASLIEQDFMGEPEKSRQTINHWVEKQTNDRIKDLLPQRSVQQERHAR
jgi:serpin B